MNLQWENSMVGCSQGRTRVGTCKSEKNIDWKRSTPRVVRLISNMFGTTESRGRLLRVTVIRRCFFVFNSLAINVAWIYHYCQSDVWSLTGRKLSGMREYKSDRGDFPFENLRSEGIRLVIFNCMSTFKERNLEWRSLVSTSRNALKQRPSAFSYQL